MLVLSSTFAIAQNRDKSELVFGKTYTMNELKDLKGVIKCASTSYEKYLQAKDPNRMTDAQFESWIAPLIENAKANKSNSGGIITIPVVVHVIHSGQPVGTAPNITANQVKSQITVMNNDFRRAVGTLGYNTSPVGADTMIQFALAKVDPAGNPTDGIHRVNLCKSFYTTDEVDAQVKPQTIWNPNIYMNMWSVNLGGSSGGVLGYAQFPTGSGLPGVNFAGAADTDGVVARFSAFGSRLYDDGTFLLANGYDQGRTMTHEVGHFLGLRHIWGDTNCGTDYCADTPTAHTANYACNKNIASCDNPAINEMVENYMDYTSDSCMNIFTIDQKFRITTVMNNSPRRMQLKTSTAEQAIPLFPNDAEVIYEKSCNSTSNITCASSGSPSSFKILLYNRGTSTLTSAVINYSVGGVVQTYNYNGNLAPNAYAEIPFSIAASVPSGVITATVTTVNGVADQRASNNSFSANYVSATPPVVGNGNYTLTLQNDYFGSEVYWELTDSSTNLAIYTGGPYPDVANPQFSPLDPPITQTFALANGCYTFTIYDYYGDGISDQGGYYNLKNSANQIVFEGTPYTTSQSRAVNVTVLSTNEAAPTNSFSIYPNPVDDILNITKVSNKAVYEIYGVSGQLLNKGSIKNGKVVVSDLIKGNYIIKITDQEMSSTLKFIKK